MIRPKRPEMIPPLGSQVHHVDSSLIMKTIVTALSSKSKRVATFEGPDCFRPANGQKEANSNT